jgi:hypothetical protein
MLYSALLRSAAVPGLKLDTVAVAVLPEAVVTRIVAGATKAVPCVPKVYAHPSSTKAVYDDTDPESISSILEMLSVFPLTVRDSHQLLDPEAIVTLQLPVPEGGLVGAEVGLVVGAVGGLEVGLEVGAVVVEEDAL